jgi:hypothetical protein
LSLRTKMSPPVASSAEVSGERRAAASLRQECGRRSEHCRCRLTGCRDRTPAPPGRAVSAIAGRSRRPRGGRNRQIGQQWPHRMLVVAINVVAEVDQPVASLSR